MTKHFRVAKNYCYQWQLNRNCCLVPSCSHSEFTVQPMFATQTQKITEITYYS